MSWFPRYPSTSSKASTALSSSLWHTSSTAALSPVCSRSAFRTPSSQAILGSAANVVACHPPFLGFSRPFHLVASLEMRFHFPMRALFSSLVLFLLGAAPFCTCPSAAAVHALWKTPGSTQHAPISLAAAGVISQLSICVPLRWVLPSARAVSSLSSIISSSALHASSTSWAVSCAPRTGMYTPYTAHSSSVAMSSTPILSILPPIISVWLRTSSTLGFVHIMTPAVVCPVSVIIA
ncbi:hypothetical protein Ctob_013886, partial [Chrysochromulina tobinii]